MEPARRRRFESHWVSQSLKVELRSFLIRTHETATRGVVSAFMPEQPYFPRITTARELVEDHARLLGMSKGEASTKAEGALERVALRRDAWNEPLRSYSKGMIQRTGLAQAIVGAPNSWSSTNQ